MRFSMQGIYASQATVTHQQKDKVVIENKILFDIFYGIQHGVLTRAQNDLFKEIIRRIMGANRTTQTTPFQNYINYKAKKCNLQDGS